MHLLSRDCSVASLVPFSLNLNFFSHDSQKDSPPTPPLLSAVLNARTKKKPKGTPLFLSAAQPTDQGEEGVLVVVIIIIIVVVGGGHFSVSHVQFFGV